MKEGPGRGDAVNPDPSGWTRLRGAVSQGQAHTMHCRLLMCPSLCFLLFFFMPLSAKKIPHASFHALFRAHFPDTLTPKVDLS